MLCILLLSSTTESADSRQVFSSESSPWLRAVGKLQVPGQRYRDGHRSHYMEDCSATLVSNTTQHDANIIITAWHCIELYSDLSKPILFTALTRSGEPVKREALRLADGGGMHADWAILRLRRNISSQQIIALNVHPHIADPDRTVTMAGYSRDSGIGDSGETLTFDPASFTTNSAVSATPIVWPIRAPQVVQSYNFQKAQNRYCAASSLKVMARDAAPLFQ